MATSASLYEGPTFYFTFYLYARVMEIFTLPFIFSLFGKHYVLEKDPDIHIHSDVGDHKLSLLTLPLR